MGERGQASIEVVAAVPAMVLIGLLCLQLLATGYSASVADGAAEAGALALASGLPADDAVDAALPDWARDRADVDESGGRVTVTVRPPSPLAPLARALEVTSSVWVRRPAEGG
jgi:hypothetical protein